MIDPTRPPSEDTVDGQAPKTTTLLVVDDDASVRRACRRMLWLAGYEVLEASDTEEALQLLAEGHGVHVVVSDVRMPHDGYRLGKEVAGRTPPVAIVFITGSDTQFPEIAAIGPLLTKPFTGEQLLESIQQVRARIP
jgi:CheY-like chemotaxis protein